MTKMIPTSSKEQVVFRDYPLTVWLIGVVAIVVGALISETVWLRLIFVLIGIAAVGLVSILKVTFDQSRGTLDLQKDQY